MEAEAEVEVEVEVNMDACGSHRTEGLVVGIAVARVGIQIWTSACKVSGAIRLNCHANLFSFLLFSFPIRQCGNIHQSHIGMVWLFMK